MFKQRLIIVLIQLVVVLLLLGASPWLSASAEVACCSSHPSPSGTIAGAPGFGHRSNSSQPPGLTIDPYVRPELADRMEKLRPVILAAAARHNRPALSGMSDRQFAEVIALVMYNEHNGWFEDDIEPLRVFTPLYQELQQRTNESGIGSNFSVWPANLRPSVALEILRCQLPVPGPTKYITVPVEVTGSRIIPERYPSRNDLLAAISAEISDDAMAVEYLAANLARGVYRAQFEGVTISWRTLAAWHNQGLVDPLQIQTNSVARDYVRRASAYLPLAHQFITDKPERGAYQQYRLGEEDRLSKEAGDPTNERAP